LHAREVHTPREVRKAAVSAQPVEEWLDLENEEQIIALLVCFREPVHSFAGFTQTGMCDGDLLSRHLPFR